MSSPPPRDERPFDIVMFGATGFTGKLVAQYLAGSTHRSTAAGHPPLRWAVAGRDRSKLESVRASLRLDAKIAQRPDIIVADIDDTQALQKMAAQARCVITTVGPYAKYGEPLVAACVKMGTDYCDLTGEAIWAGQMIAKYSEQAAKSGAILVHMSGYDSVPSDLCAFLAAQQLRERGTRVQSLYGYASMSGAGFSGGTFASILAMAKLPTSELKKARDPYQLNPPDQRPSRPLPQDQDQMLPRWDDTVGRWTSPWVMASVNMRCVRRSIALRQQLSDDGVGDGEECGYNECQPHSTLVGAAIMWIFVVLSFLALLCRPLHPLLQHLLPKPGEGPSEAKRARTTFSHRVIAHGEDGSMAEAVMRGGDPGYTETAKFISEMGLLLAQDRERLPLLRYPKAKAGPAGRIGGFFTPSVVGGEMLAERLKGGGLKISVGPFRKH